jgi:small subunit ribosomal protein S8
MSVSDPISDMLTRIRNASRAKHPNCLIPGSSIKKNILEILAKEGYIQSYEIVQKGAFNDFQVNLKYDEKKRPLIQEIERVSKPGRRVYIESEAIRPYRNNIGTLILSTSKGVITGKKAKRLKVGGEILCKVF